MPLDEWLLICATEFEGRAVADAIAEPDTSRAAGKLCIRGALAGRPCRLLHTGLGVANAASALAVRIDRRRPGLVLQFGIGGAYRPGGLPVGRIACATEEIYGDVGVLTPDGWCPADLIGIPLVPGDPPRFNRYPLDPELVRRAADLCGAAAGPFVTLSQCTGIGHVGDALGRRFGALCESMEGAAAAQVCALYDVPFLEVRAVSNLVEDRDRSRWDLPGAIAAAQQAVLTLVRQWGDGPAARDDAPATGDAEGPRRSADIEGGERGCR